MQCTRLRRSNPSGMLLPVPSLRNRAAQQQHVSEWGEASVGKLISENKLAPTVSSEGEAQNEECPICFLVSPSGDDYSQVSSWTDPKNFPITTPSLGLFLYQHSDML
jgi:hypothetical protein